MKPTFVVAVFIFALAHLGAGAAVVNGSREYPPEVTVFQVPGETDSAVSKTYLLYRNPVTWEEGVQTCLLMDAQIATIRNDEEHRLFTVHVLAKPNVTEDLWINGRQTPEGNYQFLLLGQLPQPVIYTHFKSDCPDRKGPYCISVLSYFHFKCPTYWFPNLCSSRRPVACELL